MVSRSRNLGPYSNIVTALRQYRNVPVDFLADQLGKSSEELEGYIATLEDEGVVRRKGEEVSLADPARRETGVPA